MYVRCTDCLASTWTEVVRPGGLAKTVECGECGRRHALSPIEVLGNNVRDHYRRALSYSNEHNLDMSSAYSVLIGIMSLEHASVLRHTLLPKPAFRNDDGPEVELDAPARSPGAEAPRARPVKPDQLPLVPDFDLGFSKAIAEGHMTVQQAMTRGDRDAFAMRLVRRHNLSKDLAYRVTDNRMNLRDALELKEHVDRRRQQENEEAKAQAVAATRSRRKSVSRWQLALVFAVAAVALFVVIRTTWSRQYVTEREPVLDAPSEPTPAETPSAQPAMETEEQIDPRLAATDVRSDSMGRVISVVGPDPTSVLLAYCQASQSALGLEPLEITSTVPRFRNARLGVFRDFSSLESTYAIRIRKDSETGRWIAGGDGDFPVQVIEAPQLPQDATRIAIKR